jgi:hypothetical protein
MTGYIEPSFPLYEFDPGAPGVPAAASAADGAARRRFWHWNGLVGAPAVDVTLAWADGPASALVCTSAEAFDAPHARFVAAHLALGGTFLPAADRPAGATEIARRMEELRDDDGLWSPIPGLVPKVVRTEGADCDAFTLAYTLFDTGAVFIAAVGIPLRRLAVRVADA